MSVSGQKSLMTAANESGRESRSVSFLIEWMPLIGVRSQKRLANEFCGSLNVFCFLSM